MGRRKIYSDAVKTAVAEAYLQGARITDIEKEFEIPRGTVYWLLSQSGVTPARQFKTEHPAKADLEKSRLVIELLETKLALLELKLAVERGEHPRLRRLEPDDDPDSRLDLRSA